MLQADAVASTFLLSQIIPFTSIFHSLLGNNATRKQVIGGALPDGVPPISGNSLTILEWLARVNHCAALSLLEQTCRAHHKRFGTHATYLIVLTGLLASKAKRLLCEGYEAEELIASLRNLRKQVSLLLAQERIKLNSVSKEALYFGVCHGESATGYSAAIEVAELLHGNEPSGNWHFGSIVVKRLVLLGEPQCRMLDGVALQYSKDSAHVVRKVLQTWKPGKLALFIGRIGRMSEEMGSLEASKFESNVETGLPTPGVGKEKDYTFANALCQSLVNLAVSVVASSEKIEDKTLRFCADQYGILIIPQVPLADLEFLARQLGCYLLNGPACLTKHTVSETKVSVREVQSLGNLTEVLMVAPLTTTMETARRTCHPTPPLCVLCTGRAYPICETVEYTFWSTLYRLRNIYTAQQLYKGKCIPELVFMRRYASTNPDRCCSVFAEAIGELADIIQNNAEMHRTNDCREAFDDVQGKDAALSRAIGLVEVYIRGTLR